MLCLDPRISTALITINPVKKYRGVKELTKQFMPNNPYVPKLSGKKEKYIFSYQLSYDPFFRIKNIQTLKKDL